MSGSLSYRRWRILAFLIAFASVLYLQQKSITIAGERIIPQLHLSQLQFGFLQWALLLGYTSFQFIGGVLGQRIGARRAFVISGFVAAAAILGTSLAPRVVSGTALFAALFGGQFLLGLAQAPTFPVAAGVLAAWFPVRLWGLTNGLLPAGVHLGAALAPPLIVLLMDRHGWQWALLLTTLPSLGLIALWARHGRNTPCEDPSVSAAELAELRDNAEPAVNPTLTLQRVARLLRNRSLVLLSLSYCCMSYIFYLLSNWCFLYLIQERHFTVAESSWLATLPPLSAATGCVGGGKLTDMFCARWGPRWGGRIVPLLALPLTGGLLLLAGYGSSAHLAVAALAISFASVELAEGTYWAAAMQVARTDTMVATGFLNTLGNLGGLLGIPLVAYYSGRGIWTAAFVTGALLSIIAAVTWLGVDTTDRLAETHPAL